MSGLMEHSGAAPISDLVSSSSETPFHTGPAESRFLGLNSAVENPVCFSWAADLQPEQNEEKWFVFTS